MSRWAILNWVGVGVLATLAVVLFVEARGQGTTAAPPAGAQARPQTVDDLWPLGVKADRLQAYVRYQPTEPTPETKVVNNDPVQIAPPATVVEPIQSVRITKRRKDYAFDICRGHGRYYINGGKSWRCRRS